jgi:hypothetical protein
LQSNFFHSGATPSANKPANVGFPVEQGVSEPEMLFLKQSTAAKASLVDAAGIVVEEHELPFSLQEELEL